MNHGFLEEGRYQGTAADHRIEAGRRNHDRTETESHRIEDYIHQRREDTVVADRPTNVRHNPTVVVSTGYRYLEDRLEVGRCRIELHTTGFAAAVHQEGEDMTGCGVVEVDHQREAGGIGFVHPGADSDHDAGSGHTAAAVGTSLAVGLEEATDKMRPRLSQEGLRETVLWNREACRWEPRQSSLRPVHCWNNQIADPISPLSVRLSHCQEIEKKRTPLLPWPGLPPNIEATPPMTDPASPPP